MPAVSCTVLSTALSHLRTICFPAVSQPLQVRSVTQHASSLYAIQTTPSPKKRKKKKRKKNPLSGSLALAHGWKRAAHNIQTQLLQARQSLPEAPQQRGTTQIVSGHVLSGFSAKGMGEGGGGRGREGRIEPRYIQQGLLTRLSSRETTIPSQRPGDPAKLTMAP